MKKQKKWWQHLLVIPVVLLIDLVTLVVASIVDTRLAGGGQGHGAPFITLFVILIFGILTVILVIRAIVLCIKVLMKDPEADVNSVQYSSPFEVEEKKPVWKCFIPLIIQVSLSILIVIAVGTYEINSFYADPNHIGFAVPFGSFMLAVVFFAVSILLAAICGFFASKRAKRNKEIDDRQ